MAKDKFGIFRPTKQKLLTFVLLGIICVAIGYVQPQLHQDYRGTSFGLVLTAIGLTGNTMTFVSTVLGFYVLVCLVLHYVFKKK